MEKVKFQYQKLEGMEEKEVVVLKENRKYLEGIELDNEVTEELYNKLMSKYRKFKKDKIVNSKFPIDNNKLIEESRKKIEYFLDLDLSDMSEQIVNQIELEKKRIKDSIQNIKILINVNNKGGDLNE